MFSRIITRNYRSYTKGSSWFNYKLDADVNYTVGWTTLALINANLAKNDDRDSLSVFGCSLIAGPIVTAYLALTDKNSLKLKWHSDKETLRVEWNTDLNNDKQKDSDKKRD